MLRKIILAALPLFSTSALAVDIQNGAVLDSNYIIYDTGANVPAGVTIYRFNPQRIENAPSSGVRVGKYDYQVRADNPNTPQDETLTREGSLFLTAIDNNPSSDSDVRDVYQLENLGIDLEGDCKYVALGQWRVGSSVGRFSWCFLKQEVDGEVFKGLFWMSKDAPNFAGEWNGSLK